MIFFSQAQPRWVALLSVNYLHLHHLHQQPENVKCYENDLKYKDNLKSEDDL